MQTISQNRISQTQHGPFKAVDISPSPDPDYYAPEDGKITALGMSGTCGLRLELTGATGRHGTCHNEKVYVKLGDTVKRGQKLARMGYTGLTDPDDVPAGTHVHWVINRNGTYVYPPSLVNQPFIKLEGGGIVEPGDYRVNEGDIINIYNGMLGRAPSNDEINIYRNKTYKEMLYAFMGSDEFKARLAGAGGFKLVTEQLYRKGE